jgi:DNA-nicking Smr family endonuclease
VQAQIDLHGLNRDQARTALAEFVHSAVRQNKRCLRVIHGKGLGSKQRRPILKALAKRWLRLSDNVLAFCQARPFDGGDGVLLVLLRGHKDNASTLPVGHSS